MFGSAGSEERISPSRRVSGHEIMVEGMHMVGIAKVHVIQQHIGLLCLPDVHHRIGKGDLPAVMGKAQGAPQLIAYSLMTGLAHNAADLPPQHTALLNNPAADLLRRNIIDTPVDAVPVSIPYIIKNVPPKPPQLVTIK